MSACHRPNKRRRRFGMLGSSLSIEAAARKCVDAAVSWGGVVEVFANREGVVTCVIPLTVMANQVSVEGGHEPIGLYTVCKDDRKWAEDLIAGDLEQYLVEAGL